MNELKSKNRGEMIGGGILILLGATFLIGQWLPDNGGLLIPLVAGIMFLLWGVLVRHAGPIIPGGIFVGIGLGILLNEVFFPEANDAIFLFGFGLGWLIITLASAVFTDETQWWALIVTAVMWTIAAAATFGGILLTVLSWAGTLWPLILIGIGLWVVVRHGFLQKSATGN